VRCFGSVSYASVVPPHRAVLPRTAQDEGVASVHEAVRQGINFFDCSPCVPPRGVPRIPA